MPALVGWAARSVAERVVDRRNVLTQLSDDEIMNILRNVPWEERDTAAVRGTDVHGYAHRIALGEQVDVPELLVGYVDAYLSWWEAWHPSDPIITEAVVINRQYSYMGTLDFLAAIPGLGLTLLDYKTAKSGVFAETALQLAAYGHAETIVINGEERPMPGPIDTYAALWLTSNSWVFYPMDVDEEAFRTFLYAGGVHRWMKRRAGDKATNPVKGEELLPPRPALQVVNGGAR